MNWRRLLMLKTEQPEAPDLDERESQVVQTLARVSGKTPDEIRREQRRRALSLEVGSMRHR